ncbi:hypothetical protein E1295_44505 [Nonomuraea mesophila]|uniref:Uncharacterized protein n=1 Tax=Nonomuraea mesophila TaxID=2530382 RepID=A0A4R5E6D6_9ACTN|nr:hypothetical protein [Nonomuraea mesophila]TDE26378.1 hypothetical protein E1295_44505 [Nonomuraea mesophila]
MGLDVLAKARIRVIPGDTPTRTHSRRHLPLNLQKQDHAKIDSYTTSVDVTGAGFHGLCGARFALRVPTYGTHHITGRPDGNSAGIFLFTGARNDDIT